MARTWPEDWPAAICDARTNLDTAVDDVTAGIKAADDDDAAAVRDDAGRASSAVAGVVEALDAVTEWDRGRGVAVNLRAAATHLGNASKQLTNWSTRPTAARLSAAKTYLASAKTSLSRAATNQKTLVKATGFRC